jgi:hypothetical protein
MSLATVEAYAVVSQDEAVCWIWQRDPTTRAFPARPLNVQGRGEALAVACFGMALPLADIYRGIPTREER